MIHCIVIIPYHLRHNPFGPAGRARERVVGSVHLRRFNPMRSWASKLVPAALTSLSARASNSFSRVPPWSSSTRSSSRSSSITTTTTTSQGSKLESFLQHAVRSSQRGPSAAAFTASLHGRQCRASRQWQPSAAVRHVSQLATRSALGSNPCLSPRRMLFRLRLGGIIAGTTTTVGPFGSQGVSTRRRVSTSGVTQLASGTPLRGSGNSVEELRGASDTRPGEPLTAPWPEALSHNTLVGHTIAETVRDAAKWLEIHGVVDPEPSATELLAKAAGFRSPHDMFAKLPPTAQLDMVMTSEGWMEMRRLCGIRAAQHVPVQYLVGEWDFYRLCLEMEPPTLIPRPETEELVDTLLKWLRREVVADGGALLSGNNAGLRFLDVGSGTGAIGLALLNELPGASCVAIDPQEAAVRLSRRNAERTGLQGRYSCFLAEIAEFGVASRENTAAGLFEGGDKAKAEQEGGEEKGEEEQELVVDGAFDFVVSNPPYIPRRDMEGLPPDVADHEDSVALDGGEDGLDVVRDIVRRCPRLLRRGGARQLWMEVDTSHPEAMQRWLGLVVGGERVQECRAQGVTKFEWMSDLSQRPRFVRLTFAEEEGLGLEGGL